MAVSYFQIQPLNVSCGLNYLFSCPGSWNGNKKNFSVVLASSSNVEKDLSLKSKMSTLLDSVKWDDEGLAVAIAQNIDTGAILMQGMADRKSLASTISSRQATFYSRSCCSLSVKEETPMNVITIHDIFLDCDRDSIIYLGKPDWPACHTEPETCYYTSLLDGLNQPQALTTLYALECTIDQRKAELASTKDAKTSWTKRLLLDQKLLCSKVREEADELCRTLEYDEDKSRTASEMADVLYHAMTLLAFNDLKFEKVLEDLRGRIAMRS